MRTTINVDDELFQEVMLLTAARNKTEAVRQALTEFIRLRRKEQLLAMRGTMDLAEDWRALRSLEMAEETLDGHFRHFGARLVALPGN